MTLLVSGKLPLVAVACIHCDTFLKVELVLLLVVGVELLFSPLDVVLCDYVCGFDLLFVISDCDKMRASMIEMNRRNIIDFEEGWDFIQEGIKKVKRILEGQTESFSAEECMMLYTYP